MHGTGACQVTMTTARFVVATFAKIPTELETRYYHTDAIGSVRAITDEAGQTIIRHDYGPFGEDTQPLDGDPRRFTGWELDAETGLNYAVARYYRNIWGRFLSPDPVGGTLTNPQRWNGYAYALNNPLRFIDPMGTMSHDSDPNLDDPANLCSHTNDDGCYDGQEYYCYINPGCSVAFAMSEMQQESYDAHVGSVDLYWDLFQAGFKDNGDGSMTLTFELPTLPTEDDVVEAITIEASVGVTALVDSSEVVAKKDSPEPKAFITIPGCNKECLEIVATITPAPVGGIGIGPGQTNALRALFGSTMAGAKQLISRLSSGEKVPLGDVTWETLNKYEKAAVENIIKHAGNASNLVGVMTQQLRSEAIHLLRQLHGGK